MYVRKFILGILAISTLAFTGGTLVVSAQDDSFVGPPAPTTKTNVLEVSYKPLAPLPLTGGAPVTEYTLSTYLSGMLKLIIALGAAFAVLMGVVGGVQYVASGITPSKKNEAKDRIWNAITGLVLVLTSYLILNTINPQLVAFNLSLPAVKGTSATVAPITSTVGVQPSQQFVTLSSSIPQKPPGQGCAAPGPCQVSSQILPRLLSLNQQLNQQGITWQVTEAWPPTREHRAACQNPGPEAGTCVDAKIWSMDAPSITKFIAAASNSGLRAVYEVTTEARKQELLTQGVPTSSIINAGAWITGEHFSVYKE